MRAVVVRAAFEAQVLHCAGMGSPFTARLSRLCAERLGAGDPVSDRLLGWRGDPSPRADGLPLRLAGALHGLVLAGLDPVLAAAYPPNAVSDADLWAAVRGAFGRFGPEILARLEGPPQTNEPQRSGALAPGMLTVAALTGLPLVTSELGASAGLNLLWDRFSYMFGGAPWGEPEGAVRVAPDWQGGLPPLPEVTVTERVGCDQAPLDLRSATERVRLLSYVWADQSERLARTAAAIDLAVANGVRVQRADAVVWLAGRLAVLRPGRAHVVYHSIFWQYLTPEAQAEALGMLEAAGARADAGAPLAWLRMEGDGAGPGAALTLTLWPGGETRTLARVDFHGAWVRWSGW